MRNDLSAFNCQPDSGDADNDLGSEDSQTDFQRAVKEYLSVECDYDKLTTISVMLESEEIFEDVLKSQKERLFEIVCRMKPPEHEDMQIQIDLLLDAFICHGIDLNDRNKNGETFLMLACRRKRTDIVRSLIKLTSSGFVLDIDAVDNSGETALMKAKQGRDSEVVAVLLILKLIYALEDKNENIIRSVLDEFRSVSDILVKSWSLNLDRDDKFKIWRDAMIIAMEQDTKHSEEILKLLLDDEIMLNIESEICYPILNRLIRFKEKVDDDKKLRLIEMLLESGKINVNSIGAADEDGWTALHMANDSKLTPLFIRYGADVSRKDNKENTLLIPLFGVKVEVLQLILEDAGTLVDLNAMDCDGQTVLMKAASSGNKNVAELLLKAGASVNLSDHLGFTALHHALYRNMDEFPRNSEELKKIKKIAIFFDAEELHEQCNWYRRNEQWSEIVEMLLRTPDIDVNALSFEKFSPLDITEGSIQEYPSSIKNALKEKGAVLNVFKQTESPSTGEFHLDVRCRRILQRIVFAPKKEILDFMKDRLRALIETFKEQIIAGKDRQGRTALHLAAISFYTLGYGSGKTAFGHGEKVDLANAIVNELISLGCNVNETDMFGRTPLHYANNILREVLISYGADASFKDKDGNVATDELHQSSSKVYDLVKAITARNDETYLLRLLNNKQMQINVQYIDTQDRTSNDRANHGDKQSEIWQKEVKLKTAPELLWEECDYAFRHPLINKITEEVIDLVDAIVKEVERLDPRFKIRAELVGGSNEGTKLDEPDEFDFCFVLTGISELCEVSQSPELPTGFVRLKRKPTKAAETKLSDCEDIFNEDGTLNTEKLKWQFAAILRKALVNLENQQRFERHLDVAMHKAYAIEKALTISMVKPLNYTSIIRISLDIVPCIHVNDWWPEEAISNVSEKIKTFGCNLVFDRPQQLYPWVPYSESCARISFSKAESDMIKGSCANAREAYMIGKTMVEKSQSDSKYTLKNCLLYCIEALSPSPEKSAQLGLSLEEMKSKFHQMDRYLWLKCLMKCHLEFAFMVFCPCYFMPNFISPILKEHIKERDFPKLCKNAYAFYRYVSSDTSEFYQSPAPDPLWERFDRNQLMATVFEIAYM